MHRTTPLHGLFDHLLSRPGQGLQGRPTVTGRIAFKVGTVRPGYGSTDLIDYADDQWRVRRVRLLRPLLDRGFRWVPLFFQNSWIPATQAGMMSGTSAKNSS